MAARFGASLARMWPSGIEQVKPVWERDLSRLSESELRRGMSMLKRVKFPPTLNELLEICRPAVDFEAAFGEAQIQMTLRSEGKDKWAHSAIYWAAVRYGDFDLRMHSWQQAKTKWTRLLTEAMTEKLPPVPERLLALPSAGEALTDRETAIAKLAEVHAILQSKVVKKAVA